MSYLLGIDGGFANVGYALVEYEGKPQELNVVKMGLLETKKSAKKVPESADNVRRARLLFRKLRDEAINALLDHSKNKYPYPQAICVEAMSYPRSAATSSKLGIFWGVVAATSELMGMPVVQATPQEIKEACTGSKTASKGELRARLSMHYPSSMKAFEEAEVCASKAEHCWDALGAVVACLETDVVRALVQPPVNTLSYEKRPPNLFVPKKRS